jgi:hypothetical protein
MYMKLNLVFEWDPKIFEFDKNYQNHRFKIQKLKLKCAPRNPTNLFKVSKPKPKRTFQEGRIGQHWCPCKQYVFKELMGCNHCHSGL